MQTHDQDVESQRAASGRHLVELAEKLEQAQQQLAEQARQSEGAVAADEARIEELRSTHQRELMELRMAHAFEFQAGHASEPRGPKSEPEPASAVEAVREQARKELEDAVKDQRQRDELHLASELEHAETRRRSYIDDLAIEHEEQVESLKDELAALTAELEKRRG